MEKNLKIAVRLLAGMGLSLGICLAIIQEQRHQIQSLESEPTIVHSSVFSHSDPHLFIEIQDQTESIRLRAESVERQQRIQEEMEKAMEEVRQAIEEVNVSFE